MAQQILPPEYRRIGVIAKLESNDSKKTSSRLTKLLKKQKNIQVWCEKTSSRALVQKLKSTDLLFTVGGDGTLLRGARLLLSKDGWKHCGLVGVNTGRLGFLAVMSPKMTQRDMGQLDYGFEVRSCLEVRQMRNGRVIKSAHVLNDIVIGKADISRLIEFSIELNGVFLSSYRADGIIVSTPTGSTAYNLAAGGAILEPQIPAFQLTPICPQSFSNKPIVVSDQNEVCLKLKSTTIEIVVTLDGQTAIKVAPSDQLLIRRSTKSIRLFSYNDPKKSDYLQSLRQKLKWGLVP